MAEDTASPATRITEAEPFTEHTVRMLVTPALLVELLHLPAGSMIHDVQLKPTSSGFGYDLHFHVHMYAPARAVTMEPTYVRSTGWPDPVHLHDIAWSDREGRAIGGHFPPQIEYRTARVEQHPRTPPAATAPAPDHTPVPDTRPSVGMARCPDVLQFVGADHHRPDVQCSLYEGHLERHETQPLAPVREDRSDGVHMFLWTRDVHGKLLEVNEQRIDDDPDETLGELDA